MDLLLLSASARKKGNCDYLLQRVLKGITEEGLMGEILYLTDYRINPCQGCLSCVYRGECPQDDDVDYLVEKLVQTRGLVVAAPTYLFSATGLIKTLIDRSLNMVPHMQEIGKSKRWAVTISVAGNARWNYQGVESVNLLALAYQYRILDYLEAFAPGPGEVLLQEDLMITAGQKGRNLAQALKGEGHPRSPSPLQCPCCYSQSFRFTQKNKVLCPCCGLTGRIEDGLPVIHGGEGDHFFHPENLKEHLLSWVIASRDRFKKNLPALRKERDAFRHS